MSLCRHCLRQATPALQRGVTGSGSVNARSFSRTVGQAGRNTSEELEKVKARAWYLDPSPAAPTTPSSSSRSPSASTSTSIPKRQPIFTTFDPESTKSDDLGGQGAVTPLPENATSPILIQLHRHLTAQSDSVDPTSVRFLHPASSQLLSEQTDKMASEEGSGYEALLGESGGTGWEWVVVCQVRGRGRGVINRAEKEIRKWMREELGRKTRSRTASRAEGDTDWAMIHVGEGVCVNLFTEEGRERWNLEELWA